MNLRSGASRRRSIRRMVSGDALDLRRCCLRRRLRYREFVQRLGADHVLTAWSMSLWHDAEYALSIVEGYYDPRSERSRTVLRTLAGKGHEVTGAELMELRRGIMAKVTPVLRGAMPAEWGCVVRYCSRKGSGQGAAGGGTHPAQRN